MQHPSPSVAEIEMEILYTYNIAHIVLASGMSPYLGFACICFVASKKSFDELLVSNAASIIK